jgi:large subunit ribosomal protein L9
MIEVILLERIESLGQMGEVVRVRPGFARNFLLPKKKALRATKANLDYFETQRTQLEAANLARRSEAEKVAGKVDGLAVVVIRQAGESGQLYGSVTARDIAEAVHGGGVTVERQQIVLDRPIKSLGLHKLKVRLHPEVSVAITVNVARSPEEADTQAKTGQMVTRETLEEAEEAAIEAALQEVKAVEAEAAPAAEAKAE